MLNRKVCLALVTAISLSASFAWALGFQLSESKDDLKLNYDIAVEDHDTGRVTVVMKISDQGRLKPIDSIELSIPDEGKSGFADLSVALAASKEDGKQVVRVHLLKEWAKRAEIRLTTHRLDGKQEPLTWYYHSIPIAEHFKDE